MKLGGMGIIFADSAKTEYQNSRKIAESLTKLHLEQSIEDNINRDQLIISRKKNCSIIQKKTSKFDNRFTNQQNSFKQN